MPAPTPPPPPPESCSHISVVAPSSYGEALSTLPPGSVRGDHECRGCCGQGAALLGDQLRHGAAPHLGRQRGFRTGPRQGHASGCGPCLSMRPIDAELSSSQLLSRLALFWMRRCSSLSAAFQFAPAMCWCWCWSPRIWMRQQRTPWCPFEYVRGRSKRWRSNKSTWPALERSRYCLLLNFKAFRLSITVLLVAQGELAQLLPYRMHIEAMLVGAACHP